MPSPCTTSPSSAARIFRIDRARRRSRAGGGLVIVMIIVCVLSVVAGSLLLTTITRYHTTFQSASWQESIVASEAGVDLAMNELRKRVIMSPSASFQTGWTTLSPATGKPYPAFGHAFPGGSQPYSLPAHGGEGNTLTQARVYLDVPGSDAAPSNFAAANDNSFISQLDNPNLRDADGVDRSRWWYRIRSLGIAGVSGPPRPNLDKRDNRLRQISFFNDWRTGQSLATPQAARLVEVVARPLTNFRNALMADKAIDLSNMDVLIDSYDSSKGLYSATNQGSMGNIATNGQLINANSATVKGDAMTNNGTVQNGDKVTGQQSSNFYQELTPLTPAMLDPGWANVKDGGTLTANATYTASTDATNPTTVHLDGINLPAGGQAITLAAPTAAVGSTAPTPSYIKVYVQGDILTSGSSSISVANGVNAIIYFTGNINLRGSGIINGTQLARNLVLNGIQPPANSDGTYPSRTINVATTQDFEGIIYAPNHDLILALQAVAAATSATATTVPTVTYTGTDPQIPSLVARITDALSNISDLQNDYQSQLANYNKNGDNGAYKKMQDDQTQIGQQQTLIQQLTTNINQLGGTVTIAALSASQAADHAQGYNGIYGGFVGKSITVAAKTHVHYDETLRNAGPVNHYEIVNWFEDNASRDATGGPEQFWWPGMAAK